MGTTKDVDDRATILRHGTHAIRQKRSSTEVGRRGRNATAIADALSAVSKDSKEDECGKGAVATGGRKPMRTPAVWLFLVVVMSRSLVGQSCPLQIDRVKLNGMFELRITVHNSGDAPVRLTAFHVRYTTITGPPYKKEPRELVSPFTRELLVIQPHQRVVLTTLPTMDVINFDSTVAVSASCLLFSRTGSSGLLARCSLSSEARA
jgi:hypothetical protein